MWRCSLFFAAVSCVLLQATIIDRIAILVAERIIKDSDIDRDIRVVTFLNEQKLAFDPLTRRAAANRLIDQAIIQRELSVGEYQTPSDSDVDKLFAQTEHERAYSPAVFQRLLASYGLTATELKRYLLWQLTVLRFIDQRFRPAVLITDAEVDQYYKDHSASYRRTNSDQPGSLDDVRGQIRQTLTEERINKQFESWLAARRKNLTIQYREDVLR